MTLHRDKGGFSFECDTCAEILDTGADEWSAAVDALRKEGWNATPTGTPGDGDEWRHKCPGCRFNPTGRRRRPPND